MEKRKTKDQKCKTIAKGFGMQNRGLSATPSQHGFLTLKLVGNGLPWKLGSCLLSVSLLIKRMTSPWANTSKVKPVQNCSPHKILVCWLNNPWSVGYIHATKQILYWMFFLLQAKLAKHHIMKTPL